MASVAIMAGGNNAMNYVKFTVLMVVNTALEQYLKDQKILPQNA